MNNKSVSEMASLGGKARAKTLSREQRSEIARSAALVRWSASAPRATHTGELKIGDAVIPCAVLEDGRRVLTQQGFMVAVGRAPKAKGGTGSSLMAQVDDLPPFLAAENLKPFIDIQLQGATNLLQPVQFKLPSGQRAYGYEANLLPKVCEVYLKAREERKLLKSQERVAFACEILTRGLANVAIIALVDEATGHQYDRARDALAKILEAFVAKELRRWIGTFPADYYRELFRLRGWRFPDLLEDQKKRPIIVGKLTNDVVYARLAPGIRSELHRLTPRDVKGRLKHKLFQRLSEDVGHPKLREHLAKVVTVMQLSNDWNTFMQNMDRVLPKYSDLPLFDSPPVATR